MNEHEFECPRCGHCCQVRTHTPEDIKKIESKWVGLAVNEAREFYESDLNRADLINKIDEFLEEKNT